MKLPILALALAPLRAHADSPPAEGFRVFEGDPGDKKLVDASCAVVSSAGALLGRKDGERIDAHDRVVRLSVAPTRGYEAHVGSCAEINH
mgnify:CR=1 FL=1